MDKLLSLLSMCRELVGDDRVTELLETCIEESNGRTTTLTIVANAGIHHLPEELKRGEVFVASDGSFDISDAESLSAVYEEILERTAIKLREKAWSEVFLIPFGHNSLSMQLKLLVFRITRIESIDVVYAGHGRYFDLSLVQRQVILNSESGHNKSKM